MLISGETVKGINNQSRDCGSLAHAQYSIPGTALLNYTNLTLLLLALGAKVFKNYGYLDSYMQKSSSDITGATVNWYLDLLTTNDAKKTF